MLNSSTTRQLQADLDSRRRSSAARVAPRSSIVRQVERIWDPDENGSVGAVTQRSAIDVDEDSDEPRCSKINKGRSPRRRNSYRIRYSIPSRKVNPISCPNETNECSFDRTYRDHCDSDGGVETVTETRKKINKNQQGERKGSRRFSLSQRYSIAKRIKDRQEREIRDPKLQSNDNTHFPATKDEEIGIYGYQKWDPSNPSAHLESSPHTADTSKLSFQNTHRRPWFIILPQNKYRVAWDFAMAWLLACMAFYIPYRVCFYWDDDSKTEGVFWFELCSDIAFGLDIVFNFFTAYHDPKTKNVITSPRSIALRYLKGYFVIDLLATVPFGYLLSHPSLAITHKLGKLGRLPKMIKFLRAIRLLKLLRIYRLQLFITSLEIEYNIHHGITRMIKILVMVMLVTHTVACFWYLVGLTGGDDVYDGGWMYRFAFDEKSREVKYIASLYWSFSTLTTVGYGDISARTPYEQVYSMLMMLLGVSWYAYIVSAMSTIMSSFDAQAKAVRNKMICVNEFIRAAKLPSYLSKQVRSYFDYKLSRSQRALFLSKHYDADEILFELSSGLRAEILLYMEQDLVSKIPFFANKVPQFVADTITMFQPMIFRENHLIVKEGTQADEMFFLTKGTAGIYYGDSIALTVDEGSYFGEIGCIMGGIRRASVKALTTCELQALSRRNLNILLSEYPDVGEELKNVAKYRATTVEKDKKEECMLGTNPKVDTQVKNYFDFGFESKTTHDQYHRNDENNYRSRGESVKSTEKDDEESTIKDAEEDRGNREVCKKSDDRCTESLDSMCMTLENLDNNINCRLREIIADLKR